MASVGFGFTLTQFVVAVLILVVAGIIVAGVASYQSRQPPSGLSRLGSALWRLAPVIGLAVGFVGPVVVSVLYSVVPAHHANGVLFIGALVANALSWAGRRTVERRVH